MKEETTQFMNAHGGEIILFGRKDNGKEFWYYKHHPGHIIGDLNYEEE